jgi:hypothetical protein
VKDRVLYKRRRRYLSLERAGVTSLSIEKRIITALETWLDLEFYTTISSRQNGSVCLQPGRHPFLGDR